MASSAPTRDRILDATRTLLWDRGYGATSPRAVMDESGAGQGSLYHYFPTKSALGEAAIAAAAADAVALVRADLDAATEPDPLARVRRYLEREREALRGCPMGRLSADVDVRADPALLAPLTAYFDEALALLGATLAEARAAGALPAELDTDALAAALLATLQGAYVLAQTGADPARYAAAVRGAVALLDAASAG